MASRKSRSLANPVHQADILRYAPEESFRNAVRDVNHRVVQYVQAAYRSDPRFLTDQAHIDRLTAIMAPMVQAGQMSVADLTNAHLSSLFGVKHPPAPNLSTFARPGVDINTELARPFWTAVKTAREQGKTFEQALAAGEARLTKMVQTDLQMAKVRQAREVLKAGGIQRYARVTGGSACWLCEIAATQVYFTEDLLPIHPSCNCSVQPIPDGGEAEIRKGFTPEEILRHSDEQVRRMTGLVENEASLKDYQDLVAVREHGEIGPVLTWKHQSFTGPGDLPVPPSREVLEYQAYQALKANHGVTIDLGGNIPAEGFAYAPFKNTEMRVPIEDFTHKHIDDFIDLHAAELAKPGNHLGMWESNGAYYLDISRVGPDSPLTLAKAQGAHQLAAYDLARNNEITLGTINDATGAYRPLATPADLYSEYGRQVARADEVRSASGVPSLAGRTRAASESVKWTGPPVHRPSYGGDIQTEVDYDWGAKRTFDIHKDSLRAGARKAEAEGYSGVPQHLRNKVVRAGGMYEDDVLEMYGQEMVARAVYAAPTKRNLWRGMEVTQEQLDALTSATSISLPLSSFGRDADEARIFASKVPTGKYFQSASVTPEATEGVLFKLQPGAKVAPVFYGHEYAGFGQFDVVSVKPAHMGTQGSGEFRKPVWRPTEVTIKQTSMIEHDVAQAKSLPGGAKAVADKDIPEITIIKGQPGPPVMPEPVHVNGVGYALEGRGIDPELGAQFQQAVQDMKAKYPQSKLSSVIVSNTVNGAPAATYPFGGGPGGYLTGETHIRVNRAELGNKGKDSWHEWITTELRSNPRIVAHHDNPVAYELGLHEFGHTLAFTGGNRDIVLKEVDPTLRKLYKDTHPGIAKVDIEDYNAWKRKQFSDYAFQEGSWSKLNKDEALAEAFASVESNAKKATPGEHALHDLLVKNSLRPQVTAKELLERDFNAITPARLVDAEEAKRTATAAKYAASESRYAVEKAQEIATIQADYDKARVLESKPRGMPKADSLAAKTRAAMTEDRVAENYRQLAAEMDEATKAEGRVWYPEQRDAVYYLTTKYDTGVDELRGLNIAAAFSSQRGWAENFADTEAFISVANLKPSEIFDAVKEARPGITDSNIERALRVLYARNPEEIDLALRGVQTTNSPFFHNSSKIRNFGPNLAGHHNNLTIDTWMGYAARLSPDERRELLNADYAIKHPGKVKYAAGARVSWKDVQRADKLADAANDAARALGQVEPYMPNSGLMVKHGYDIMENGMRKALEGVDDLLPDQYQAALWVQVRGTGA